MAVYAPALMLQGEWTIAAVAYIVFKALLAIGLWGAAAIGYLWQPLALGQRVLATVGAAMLVAALPLTDEIGFALCAIFIGWQLWRRRLSRRDSLQKNRPNAT
jgi:TRAP-type uncharacterized transport system fused permease subunit